MPAKSEDPKKLSHERNPIQTQQSPRRERNFHVVPRDHGWAVVGAGKSREIARADSQQEAINRARANAQRRNSEVVIHDRDGRIVGREIFRDDVWELVRNQEPQTKSTEESIPGLDLRKYIETRFYGQRPHIRGRRLLVSMITANAEDNHMTVPELAYDFTISEEQVLAALLYYREHQEEIDRQDVEEQKLFDEMYRLYGGYRGKT